MAALIDAGAAIEDVALRFGTSERHVRQRLRLGKLAPELLERVSRRRYRPRSRNHLVHKAFVVGAEEVARDRCDPATRGVTAAPSPSLQHAVPAAAGQREPVRSAAPVAVMPISA